MLQERPWSSSCPLCSVAQWCPTLLPHGLQPARLLCAWDSPGKNAGVGCHFLFQGPDPGVEPLSLEAPASAGGLPLSHPGSIPCAQDNTKHRKHPSREDPGSWGSPPSSQCRLGFRSPTFLPLVNRCFSGVKCSRVLECAQHPSDIWSLSRRMEVSINSRWDINLASIKHSSKTNI